MPGATNAEQFFAGLRAGNGVVGGQHGHVGTMSSDILRFAGSLFKEQTVEVMRSPLTARTPALLAGGLAALPLLGVALTAGVIHFVHEQRFNRDLLFDLVAQPVAVSEAARAVA